jgi:hypothetical protein
MKGTYQKPLVMQYGKVETLTMAGPGMSVDSNKSLRC